MKLRTLFLGACAATLLVACGEPVPAAKTAYVGEWQASTMRLSITQDGTVRYKRANDNVTTEVNGPLQGFKGDNFDVGIGPMRTTFVVTVPPHQVGTTVKMVVDGVELSKVAQ